MISMGLVMHPQIAIAIGIFMALTSKLGTSSGAGCFFAMLNVTSFFGYGRNRSTANALSCLAPGEAQDQPLTLITRRWSTGPLARPGSQAEPPAMPRHARRSRISCLRSADDGQAGFQHDFALPTPPLCFHKLIELGNVA